MTILANTMGPTQWGGSVTSVHAPIQEITTVLPDVAVPEAGLDVAAVDWAGIPGATAVEVTSAGISIAPPSTTTVVQPVTVTAANGGFIITLPTGFQLRSMQLAGLKSGDTAITAAADLNRNRRLVIALPSPDGGGFGPPVYAVPSVQHEGAVPSSLTGARFDQGVLHLPDVTTARILLTLTDGDHPYEFHTIAKPVLAAATAELVPVPADLTVTDRAGATAWTRAGPLTATTGVDLTAVTQRALSAALTAGAPLSTRLHLKAARATTCGLRSATTRGALVRAAAATISTALTGDPVPLALGPTALASERPGSVSAELSVHYHGIRLSDVLADHLPIGLTTGIVGIVVGPDPVRRAIPPAALTGQDVVRIGVIGRAPVDATLSVQLLDPILGTALGPPAVAPVPPSHDFGTVWLAFSAAQRPSGPVVVALTATTGRFLWATGPSSTGPDLVPLIRVAVADPDPGGRPIQLDGIELTRLTAAPASPPTATALAPDAFTGPGSPVLDSPLFVTVQLSSLTLRYPR